MIRRALVLKTRSGTVIVRDRRPGVRSVLFVRRRRRKPVPDRTDRGDDVVVAVESADVLVFATAGRLAPDPGALLWSFPDAPERRAYHLDQFLDGLCRWLRAHPHLCRR